ncbi:MAG: hypothetical protein AAF772_02010, partial [Acidobacteriota bacterium]
MIFAKVAVRIARKSWRFPKARARIEAAHAQVRTTRSGQCAASSRANSSVPGGRRFSLPDADPRARTA